MELEDPPLWALLTKEAVEALGLAPGGMAFAVMKATAIVYLGEA